MDSSAVGVTAVCCTETYEDELDFDFHPEGELAAVGFVIIRPRTSILSLWVKSGVDDHGGLFTLEAQSCRMLQGLTTSSSFLIHLNVLSACLRSQILRNICNPSLGCLFDSFQDSFMSIAVLFCFLRMSALWIHAALEIIGSRDIMPLWILMWKC